jgi:monodictyphenone polyketide synthase
MECSSALSSSLHSSGTRSKTNTWKKGLLLITQSRYRYHENDTEETFDYHHGGASLAGLGTGLLSTVAVSLSPTLADMPEVGTEVIRVAFRLGVLVDAVSQNLHPHPSDGSHGDSWTYVVQDTTVDEAQSELDTYHMSEVSFVLSRQYQGTQRTDIVLRNAPTPAKSLSVP